MRCVCARTQYMYIFILYKLIVFIQEIRYRRYLTAIQNLCPVYVFSRSERPLSSYTLHYNIPSVRNKHVPRVCVQLFFRSYQLGSEVSRGIDVMTIFFFFVKKEVYFSKPDRTQNSSRVLYCCPHGARQKPRQKNTCWNISNNK